MITLNSIIKKADELDLKMYDYVMQLAKQHMRSRPHIGQFCMAMGGYSFRYVEGHTIEIDGEEQDVGGNIVEEDSSYYAYVEDDICHELVKFMDDYGFEYKITGMPLRLDKDRVSGLIELKTNW